MHEPDLTFADRLGFITVLPLVGLRDVTPYGIGLAVLESVVRRLEEVA